MGAAAPAGPGARPGAGRPGADRADAERAGAERADEAARAAADLQTAEQQLAERTADLQRVTAEYANYRKRVERDRAAVREQAVANVLSGLVPVLDDIGRAREHEELVGGFKSVAESLEAAVTKLGLESFGEDGEPFDPKVHEALMHSYSPDVTEPTCIKILQPGYRVGERILRPARVAVAEPGEAEAPSEPDGPGGPDEPGDAPGDGGVHHQPTGSGDAPGRQETSADDD
jgi:molecular chaperone GrpE